jgi:multiple sugar transport system substrate-binding protein
LGDPDGLGIPKTAKHIGAAVQFLKWWDTPVVQAEVSGLGGPSVDVGGPPVDLSSWKLLEKKAGSYAQAATMAKIGKNVQSVFPDGEPPWYSQFSNAVYTNIHSAALGTETVKQAINAIAATVNNLRG